MFSDDKTGHNSINNNNKYNNNQCFTVIMQVNLAIA